MGRASNRKKVQRQSRQPEKYEKRDEGVAEASRTWCGGAEPVPARTPPWPEGSLGHRFYAGIHLSRMRTAPCLMTAEIPAATLIHADSAHWSVAIQALVRGVAYDGLELYHPAVRQLAEIMIPVVDAELDAFGAVVGDDLFDDILGVLLPALTDAVPGLDGQAAADALIGAHAVHNNCDRPGDAEAADRMCAISCGDVLGDLAAAGAVPAELLIPVGLTMLSVLAGLCRSDSPSLLQRTPDN